MGKWRSSRGYNLGLLPSGNMGGTPQQNIGVYCNLTKMIASRIFTTVGTCVAIYRFQSEHVIKMDWVSPILELLSESSGK